MSKHGHEHEHEHGRTWGFWTAVGITLLAGVTITSQIVIASHRDHGPASQPTPNGSAVTQPLPLWTSPAKPHGDESPRKGRAVRIYLLIPNPAG